MNFKYGARHFSISVPQQLTSTAANVKYGGWVYIPAYATKGVISGEAESLKDASLVFPNSLQTASNTAAAGSLRIALTQYNSSGNSQNSAVLFDQSLTSAAAATPIDVSSLCNWTLAPGDSLILGANTNTVGIPVFGGCIFSGVVDAVTVT